MELKDKIKHVTYRPGFNHTYARIELHNGMTFHCESEYVNTFANHFGERYALEEALKMLKLFEEYRQAEERFLIAQKEHS